MASLRPVRQTILLAGMAAVAALVAIQDGPPVATGSGTLDLLGGDLVCFDDEDIDNETVPLPDPNASRQRIIARFSTILSIAERRALEAQLDHGARFLDSVPDTGYVVSLATPIFHKALKTFRKHRPSATCMGVPSRKNRSLDILNDLSVLPGYDSAAKTAPLYVRFYRDVSISAQRSFIEFFAAESVADVPAYNDEWRVLVANTNVDAFKNNNDIHWIREVEVGLEDDADEARRVVGLPGDYGNDGDGSVIAQWEVCHPAVTPPNDHADLGQRATIGLGTPVCGVETALDQGGFAIPSNQHATQVAGIAAGDGSMSVADGGMAEQWRGIASGSRLVSYSVVDGYDFGAEYLDAVSRGASISTNSWGPMANDYYFEDNTHLYPFRSSFYDTLASARDAGGWPTGPGTSLLIVASAGNRGAATIPNTTERYYWGTVRIRNSAKNVLTIGNVATGPGEHEGRPAFDSGRGPTDDGRIKPDLVAPGAEIENATPEHGYGIRSPACPNCGDGEYYHSSWGTSFSTPVVGGAAALVTTTFRTGTCDRNPTSAELRALLIHSAKDLVDATGDAQTSAARNNRRDHAIARHNVVETRYQNYVSDTGPPTAASQPLEPPPVQQELIGPDYVFGFGLVQPVAADALVEGGHFITDRIDRGLVEYPIYVDGNSLDDDGMLRVTLVWDDPPFSLLAGTDAVTGLLQNDLDLVLIGPRGRRHFPWKLDPDNPAQPATQASRGWFNFAANNTALGDHRNTVEQISIKPAKALLDQTWRVRVSGYRVRLPTQRFSLVSSIIQPATACGPIFSVRVENPDNQPTDRTRWVLLIVALVMLLLLLLWLAELVYQRYQPQGQSYAIGMVTIVYLLLLVTTLLLWTLLV